MVGDAGYCPGPAVGGSTSLAVVGAYTLAGELATHMPDYPAAFAAYEREIGDYVRRSRAFAVTAAKKLVPASAFNLWALVQTARLIGLLPGSVSRTFAKLGARNLRLHDMVAVKDYSPLQ